MSTQRNLNDGGVLPQRRKERRARMSPATNNAAIGRDGLLVYDGGVITIENGGLDVTGTATISGVLNVSGTTNITGELNIDGPTRITGSLDIKGPTTLSGNFDVLAGGKITAGVTKIEPSGKATFGDFVIDPSSDKLIQSPAGWLFTNGPDSIGLASSLSSSLALGSTFAELNFKGKSVAITSTTTTINTDSTSVKSLVTDTLRIRVPVNTTNKPNVYMDGSGWFYRSTAVI